MTNVSRFVVQRSGGSGIASIGAGIALAVLLSACASVADKSPAPTLEERLQKQNLQIGESVQRINSFGISGWSYLNERNVLIDNGPGNQYLIKTNMDCDELNFANTLGYTTTAGSLTKFDRLKSRSTTGMPVDCGIEAIYKLEKIPAKEAEKSK